MLKRRLILTALSSALLVSPMAAIAQEKKAPRSYVMATAGTGGTYYPVGVALATLAKIKLQNSHGVDMAAISSAGSGENIRLLRENQAQFAILQGLFGEWARTGSGSIAADGPQKNLRSVMMLWPNVEQVFMRADMAPTGTAADLARISGQGFAMGARNSGTEHSNRFIIRNLKLDEEKMKPSFVDFNRGVDAIINGNLAATNINAGVPTSAATRLMAQMGDRIKFLEFTDDQLKAADGGSGLYFRFVVPAGSYPGQTRDIRTIAQPNFLAVNAAVLDEDVYLFTKAVYENLPFLNNIHAATKDMSVKTAMDGLPLPLHPGALKYYQEVGLPIPDRLKP